MKKVFKIRGIDCANCAAHLEEKFRRIEGIESVNINFFTEKMIIEYSEESKEEIMERINYIIKKEEPDAVLEEM